MKKLLKNENNIDSNHIWSPWNRPEEPGEETGITR